MAAEVLDRRARNRALLARQMLLERAAGTPIRAVERLVGMQAQVPRNPYTALWSRLRGFDPMVVSGAIQRRQLVRIALMRSTIHLVTAADALYLRPLVVPILMAELAVPERRRLLAGLELVEVRERARRLLEEQPRTPAQLGAALAEHWPDRQPAVLAHVARSMLALVQIPPRGLWDGASATTLATAEDWLGASVRMDATWDTVALRYLAAFGPATAADMVAWCRIPGMSAVFKRLRPELVVLRDERDRELFDLPRAPRPRGDHPAPPRFLPDFDNVLLGHADRNHVVADAHRKAMQSSNGVLPGTLLVDGFVAATWSLERDGSFARLRVTGFEALPAGSIDEIRAEGVGLLRMLAPAADRSDIVLQH